MSDENIELLRGLYKRWAKRDYAVRDVFDPQVVFTRIMPDVPGGPGGAGVWHGIDEMWQAIVDWFRHWENLEVVPEKFIDAGDRVLVLTRQSARGKLSGVPVETKIAELFTFRAGRIVRWEIYWDRAEAMRAAGLESADLGPEYREAGDVR